MENNLSTQALVAGARSTRNAYADKCGKCWEQDVRGETVCRTYHCINPKFDNIIDLFDATTGVEIRVNFLLHNIFDFDLVAPVMGAR